MAKHAQATRVEVKLAQDGQHVRLMVADNGRGVSPKTTRSLLDQTMGIGLLGMRERLELLGGRLEVESDAGRGLRLVATLPLSAGR